MDAQQDNAKAEEPAFTRFLSLHSDGLHYKRDPDGMQTIRSDNLIAIDRSPRETYVLYTAASENGDEGAGESPMAFSSLRMRGIYPAICADLSASSHLLNGQDRIDVFISTRSGTGLAEDVWKQLIEPAFVWYGLKQHDNYDVHLTTSETTINELTCELVLPRAAKGESQTIVLLSGDGGMVDVINTLIAGPRTEKYVKPKVALLPFGTGNALANGSGITGDNTFGLRNLLKGQPKEVPVFRATFSPGARLLANEGRDEIELEGSIDGLPIAHGAVVCSWGLHATLVADSDTTEYRKFGAERFKMAGKEALYPSDGSLPHAYKGKVSILKTGSPNWQPLDGDEHGYILATLVSHLESGFRISPSSKPLDGKLRLVHFGRLSGDDAMGIMTKAYQNGQHVHDAKVGYEEIEGLRIDFAEEDARWRRVCVDGKIIRVEKGGWVEVRMGLEGVVDLLVR